MIPHAPGQINHCDHDTELIAPGRYRHTCRRPECRKVVESQSQRHVTHCRAFAVNQQPIEPQPGNIATKAVRFTAEQHKWLAAGRPVRSPEQARRIFHELCEPCRLFRPKGKGRGQCLGCGCGLSPESHRRFGMEFSKIVMATTSCPLTPPKWAAEA